MGSGYIIGYTLYLPWGCSIGANAEIGQLNTFVCFKAMWRALYKKNKKTTTFVSVMLKLVDI